MKSSWIQRVSLLTIAALLFAISATQAAGVTLQITANAVKGGKNTQDAEWIEAVISEFEREMKAQGRDVRV